MSHWQRPSVTALVSQGIEKSDDILSRVKEMLRGVLCGKVAVKLCEVGMAGIDSKVWLVALFFINTKTAGITGLRLGL